MALSGREGVVGIEVLLSGMAYESNNQSPKYLPMPAACSCQEFRRFANQRRQVFTLLLSKGLQPFEDPSHGKAPLWEASCNRSAQQGFLCSNSRDHFTGGLRGHFESTPACCVYAGYVLSCVPAIFMLAWLLAYALAQVGQLARCTLS